MYFCWQCRRGSGCARLSRLFTESLGNLPHLGALEFCQLAATPNKFLSRSGMKGLLSAVVCKAQYLLATSLEWP